MIGALVQDDFEVEELVRRNSSGGIYRARQRSLNRDVALMVLDPGAVDASACEEFLAQARRWATLNHPNVVSVFHLGTHRGAPFVVTEPVSGQLFAGMLGSTDLTMNARLRIMAGVARGLHAIHSAGIVHRNLTPNSIVMDGATAKIFDLGLVRRVGHVSFESEEQSGVETADYLSPEQIRDLGVTPATDIFAFGAMLYEVLSGVRPFHAEHPMSVALKILHEAPETLGALVPDLPEPLSALVMRCIEKDPARRPRSMAEVEREIVSIEESRGVGTLSPPSPMDQRTAGTGFNPYGNAVMIRRREDFFGRGQEVRWVYARLNSDPPGSIAIVGDRKIGKSSLLNYIYMQANRNALLRGPDRMVMVFMNLQGQDMTIESFSGSLLRMTALELGERLSISDCTPDLDGIREMVVRIHAAGYRLVIFLDEFECITSNHRFPETFFSFLRFLVTVHDVAYVTSSVRDLQSLCHNESIRDSPFFNVFSTRRLGAFLPEEARELIRVPSRRMGRPLEPYADQILELSGLFPFFIQLACSHTFDAIENGHAPDFGEIRRLFQMEVQPHFQHLWEEFEEPERDVLRRVAAGKRIPEASRHVLEELASRHYVQMRPAGPRLFATTFGHFVARAPRAMASRPDDASASSGRHARHVPPVRAWTTEPVRWILRAGALLGATAAILLAVLLLRRENDVTTPGRGVQGTDAARMAAMLPRYRNSYALVIGEVDYPHWQRLPGVRTDIREVAAVLEDHGFVVETVENEDGDGLEKAFKEFIDRRGRHKDDRLLMYFAGHGHTMAQSYGGEMGYIVPVDAPDPKQDPEGFRATAISMIQIRTYALEIQSKHVLFVFDACFAGTIFTPMREAPPASIQFNCSKPVRQFITSGTADEKVPDESHFRRWFVTGLRGGADLNRDAYVTAYELAGYLRTNVSNELGGQQNPQYGVLLEVSQGDVVFSLGDLQAAPGK